jgi:N-acyl homoserine lactone hydrolase
MPVAEAACPQIDLLLDGYAMNTDAGLAAMCAVALIEGLDADGRPTRILVDPAHVGRRTFLWEALDRRALTPADIDLVVLTHGHWDHVQNIDVFDHAPLLLHPDERRYCQRPHRNDWATPAWTGAILERMELRDIADGEDLIPGVTIVELAGHSAGSVGIAVANADGVSLLTGDALHYASVAVTRRNPLVFWDENQAEAAIGRALDLADVIYPGHDRPFQLTASGEIDYLKPFSLGLTGISRDEPGLTFSTASRDPWVMPGIEQQPALLAGD